MPVGSPESQSWSSDSDPKLWNAGTEDAPVKSKNDPCPPGWRVVTKKELDKIRVKVVTIVIRDLVYTASIKDSNIKLTPVGVELASGGLHMLMYQSNLYWFTSLSVTEAEAAVVCEFGDLEQTISRKGKTAAAPVRCIQEQTPSL